MARNLRVRAVKRHELDEDKLALAFLMLAKALSEPESAPGEDVDVESA